MERGRAIAIVAGLGIAVLLAFGVDLWSGREQSNRQFDFFGATRPTQFAESPARGAEDPDVVMYEYADFGCSHCAEFQAVVSRVASTHGARVRLVWKDFPFLSQASKDAAVAARCAHKQGTFWEYANWLFANQGLVGDERSLSYQDINSSLDAGAQLDIPAFQACRDDATIHALVERDIAEGRALGITETPTLVIGDVALVGAQTFEEVERFLAPLLK